MGKVYRYEGEYGVLGGRLAKADELLQMIWIERRIWADAKEDYIIQQPFIPLLLTNYSATTLT